QFRRRAISMARNRPEKERGASKDAWSRLPRPQDKRVSRMSTSMQPRTADLRQVKTPTDVTTRSKSGKPRDRKKQEIPRGCRTAAWQKRGIRSSIDPAEMRRAKVERPATRTEGRSQERIVARTGAMSPIAFLAQTISEYATQPGQRRLPARKTEVFPGPSQASSPLVTATMEPADFLSIAAANRVRPDGRGHLTRSVEEQESSGAGVAACAW